MQQNRNINGSGARLHRHNNEMDGLSVAKLFLIGIAVSVVLGGVAFAFSQKSLDILGLVFIVLGLKVVLSQAIRKYRVNNLVFAAIYAAICAGISLGMMHYLNFKSFIAYAKSNPATVNQGWQEMSFHKFLLSRERGELPTEELPVYYREPDFYSGSLGSFEYYAALFIVVFLVYKVANKVSCFKCDSWYKEYEVGGMQNDASQVVTALQLGNLIPLKIAEGFVRKCKLSILLCPSCELETCLVRAYKLSTKNSEQTAKVVGEVRVPPQEIKEWLMALNRNDMCELLFSAKAEKLKKSSD